MGADLGDIYDLSQFSVSRWHVKPLAERAAVVELIHRLNDMVNGMLKIGL